MSPMLRTLWTFCSRQAAKSVAGMLLVGIVALTACAIPSNGHTGTPTAAPTPMSPAWTAVLNQIGPNGEVSLATAEQAYVLVFGPLPGVSAPANTGGVIPDGTLALRMILAHYNDLNAAQQQAVLQRFGFTAPTASTVSTAPVAAFAGMTRAVQASELLNPTPVPTDEPGTEDYRTMIDEFTVTIDGFLKHFGYTLTLPVVLSFDPKLKGTDTGAYAKGINGQGGGSTGKPVRCSIAINPEITTDAVDVQRFKLAHELFHCYQAGMLDDLNAYVHAPGWLMDGSANWVGALVSGATTDTEWLNDYWDAWLTHPERSLFSLVYTAIGFYALLDQAGISPWSVFPAMLASQTKGTVPDNLAAYQAATQSAPQEVLDEWASSFERNQSLGLDWDLTGPAIPKTTPGGPPVKNVTLSNGSSVSAKTPAYTALDDDLTSQADVVEISITGTSRLHDSASFERVTSANGDYCTKQGGCSCPEGSAYTGPALTQLQGVLHLAVTGGPSGASGNVTGLSLDKFCNRKPTGVPKITLAFCQQVLSIVEANQIMQPPIPATTIRIDNGPAGGSCNYEYKQFLSVVTVTFLAVPAGHGTPAEVLAAQAANITSDPDAQVDVTPVNGVGNAAIFVTGTIADPPLRIAAFDVIDGSLFLSCANFNVGSASFSDQQTKLTHICQLVLGRL